MTSEYTKTRSDICALCGRSLLICRMAACVREQMTAAEDEVERRIDAAYDEQRQARRRVRT